jgi:hypothetical protein
MVTNMRKPRLKMNGTDLKYRSARTTGSQHITYKRPGIDQAYERCPLTLRQGKGKSFAPMNEDFRLIK